MRRRGVGIAGIKQKQAMQEKTAALGSEIEKQQLAEMTKQLAEFKASLEQFALKHKKEITNNPVFRQQFLKMCKSIGVDPLSSNKSFWVETLGVGDFYYQIAIQVVNICIALRKKNGGFLEENECLSYLRKIRGKHAQEVSIKDMRKSIQSINKLGNDFRIIQTGNKRVICSVSVELNDDHMGLLRIAEQQGGHFTHSQVAAALPNYQDKDRFNRAIEKLLNDGLAWEDSQAGKEIVYWFPNLMQGQEADDADLSLIGSAA